MTHKDKALFYAQAFDNKHLKKDGLIIIQNRAKLPNFLVVNITFLVFVGSIAGSVWVDSYLSWFFYLV